MRHSRKLAVGLGIPILIAVEIGCGPKVDADLRPFVQLQDEKAAAQLLCKPVDKQIDIYLRIAAPSPEPVDYSPGKVIATRNGDIGRLLSARITQEGDRTNLESLVRLAGQYCSLNPSCRNEYFLEDSVKTAAQRIPNWSQDPFVAQNVKWVSDGVNANSTPRLK